MITCGIDIGSRTIKVVLFDGAQIVDARIVSSGSSPSENAINAFRDSLSATGIDRSDVAKVVATGYGRNYFKEADMTSSEIICHAKGSSYYFPRVRTVIDIGGQDSKMISLDANGKVVNFVMNDRCAAGTGKFIEMAGLMLDVSLEDMSDMTNGSAEACEISTMCAVFAESEIIGLVQGGKKVDALLRGIFKSVARRTLTLAGKVAIVPGVVFTGGVARISGVVRALEAETGMSIDVPQEPQLTGALGAAIIASSKA